MTSDLSIAGLEDEKGLVYMIGVNRKVGEDVVAYLHSEDFGRLWDSVFDHAEFILVPGDFDSVLQVEVSDVEEIKDALNNNDG